MSERETNGALIGGTTGAIVGGVATHSWGGAAVGGVVGSVVGATIANATAPHRNCWYNSYGHRVCHRY